MHIKETSLCFHEYSKLFNPFNASCSKLLSFEGYSAILV